MKKMPFRWFFLSNFDNQIGRFFLYLLLEIKYLQL